MHTASRIFYYGLRSCCALGSLNRNGERSPLCYCSPKTTPLKSLNSHDIYVVWLKNKAKSQRYKEEKLEARSRSSETAALQIHTVSWSDPAPLHQESGRKLYSHRCLSDAIRPTESPIMGSPAGVTKHIPCSLMALNVPQWDLFYLP